MGFIIIIGTFLLTEIAAWMLHKYIMHGFLWSIHFDHHNKQPGFFEKNDNFLFVFAIPSALLIIFGIIHGFDYNMYMGFGILLYGIAYFLFHDVLIHRRFPKMRKVLFGKANNSYLKTLQYAHRMHHSHTGKNDGESFGMLLVHPKYFKKG